MEDYNDSEMDAENTVQLTEKMKEYLTESAKWTKFMAIVGFVILGLLFCGLVTLAVSTSFLAKAFPGIEAMGTVAPLLLFTIAFVFYGMMIFIPSWYMFGFASKTLKSIPTMDVGGMEAAFENLKSLFKFYGILMMVILGFYTIVLVVAGLVNLAM